MAGSQHHRFRRAIVLSTWLLALAALFLCPQSQAAEPLPDAASLPAQEALGDPLLMRDGRKVVSRDMWFNERRPELIRLFQHYMYGALPPQPSVVSGTVKRVDAVALGGKATLREVALRCGPPEMPPIHLMLVTPNQRTQPAPVVLALNYFGNHTLLHDKNVRLPDNWMPERGEGVVAHRSTEASRGTWAEIWRIEDLIDRGYALATFYNGDIDPDTPEQRGVQAYFPASDPAEACGTIGAWAWGLQRAVDYLVTEPALDARRIVVTGHSRLGKAALVAAAFDERIALAAPHQAGCGGSAPSRARLAMDEPWNTLDAPGRKPPETVADITTAFPHWFGARFKAFDTQPERLPFDQHCLLALCTPRPVLFTNGRADTWINPAGQFAVMKAATPVYRLLGADGFAEDALPPDGQIVGGTLGYFLRPGAHSLQREDWKAILDFADKHLGAPKIEPPPAPAGPIRIDPEHPRSFRFQNGARFFPMGDTAYHLIALPKNVIARYLDARREHGFTFIRAMAMTEGFWPFGGTPAAPDYTTIAAAVLEKWDWVFDYAAERGMNLELILWGYGVAGGEGLWADPARVELWMRTVVERFKNRPNLFMWTIANEFERYPDGQYRYQPSDVEWAKAAAARLRALDPVHPIGCHPSVWITDQGPPGPSDRPFATYGSFTQRRPQVVWPLWEDSAVNLLVTQNNEGVHPRTWGEMRGAPGRGVTYFPTRWQDIDYPARWTPDGWDFEAAGLEDSIAEDWSHGKPVLNTEFGYQREPGYENGHSDVTRQCHSPDTVRKKAWKIATAGGFFAAGFESTAVRHFNEADVARFRPHHLKVLHDFFTQKTSYWQMAPHLEWVASHNVLLASPGAEYVAYFPRGGTNDVRLAAGHYRIEWLHPATGRYVAQPELHTATEGPHSFTPPQQPADDWVLHLKKQK